MGRIGEQVATQFESEGFSGEVAIQEGMEYEFTGVGRIREEFATKGIEY